jgi:hypothetical protein
MNLGRSKQSCHPKCGVSEHSFLPEHSTLSQLSPKSKHYSIYSSLSQGLCFSLMETSNLNTTEI